MGCTGTIPENASLITGDDQGLTADVPIRLVETNTNAKYEYRCNTGFHKNGDRCEANTRSVSCRQEGKPANSHYSNVEVKVSQTWNTATKTWNSAPQCAWQCDTGYTLSTQ